MNNSRFFSEASIIANNALKLTTNEYGTNIDKAIHALRRKREQQCTNVDGFSSGKFDAHAKYYAKIAEVMLQEYNNYLKEYKESEFNYEA